MIAPNYFPHTPNGIAIVGEAPGRDEIANGRPFYGMSGRFLAGLCGTVGINFNNCYLGNVAQHQPVNNEIERFAWSGPEIQDGLRQLRDDVKRLDPNIIVLLGNVALKAAKDPITNHPLIPKAYRHSVSDWRGSLFSCNEPASPFFGYKCISSYHPAGCLRQYENTPILRFDLKRACVESKTKELVLPERNLIVAPTLDYVLHRLREIKRNKTPFATDIEGGIDSMSCISLSTSPNDAFTIPFTGPNGNYWPTDEEEFLVWRALVDVLSDPTIPKILQNSLYDQFVLAYSYATLIRGVRDDTMLKHWEAYCELPKGLAFLCSIYTRESYYKHERKVADFTTHWTYCGRDSATTIEVNNVLESHIRPGPSREHYHGNMGLLQPLLYMELQGIRYDVEGAVRRRSEVLAKAYATNYELDCFAHRSFDFDLPADQARQRVLGICGKKRGGWLKAYEEDVPFLENTLANWPPVSLSDRGRFNAVLDAGVNIKSPGYKQLLYDTYGLPKQYGKEGQLTTDYDALLRLWKKTDHQACRLGIDIAALRTRSQMLGITADPDGRIRCGYNLVGTETGRLSCYTSPTGSGYNLQTIPEYDRDLFLADEDHWMFQCDLTGADSWTVAAWLAFLGQPTMLEDLQAGIKPAKVLALLLRHGESINRLSRPELLKRCDEVKKTDWDYFTCKVGTHGTCYLMGVRRLADKVFADSEGRIQMSEAQARRLQQLFKSRYHVEEWHKYAQRQIDARPELQSANGHVRHFFGRKDEILGEWLAHEPQMNTTHATNMALWNLWIDPENRRPDGTLRIRPAHVVHDALVGMFHKNDTEWAVQRIRHYFNNPMRIANRTMVIPFDGTYGESWGNQKAGKV